MTPLRLLGLAAAATIAVSLTACSTTPEAPVSASGGDGTFPVTIEHAFGSTTIETQPERIATVAWANHEVPLALGIVPVGMSKATWGDDDENGVLPWVEDQLDALGAETPVLFDETDGIDFEAVNDVQPDIILASYSGITQEEYDTLSKIAPVIAYPEVAWGTSVEDMIALNSAALGLADEGDALIAELHADVDAALGSNTDLEGKKVLFSFIDPADFSQIGFYTSHDTRPGFLTSIGLPLPEVVVEESANTDAVLRHGQRRGGRPVRGCRRVRHLRRRRRGVHRAAAGRPTAVADPRDRRGPHRRAEELHPARRLGQPLAAVHRLGRR